MRGSRAVAVVAVALPLVGALAFLFLRGEEPRPEPPPVALAPAPPPPLAPAPPLGDAGAAIELLEGEIADDPAAPLFVAHGRVVDENGRPVAGATVTARSNFWDEGKTALSGADGSYVLKDLGGGELTVSAEHDGRFASLGTRLEADATLPDLKLARGGQLTVRVEDSEGHPLAKQAVTVSVHQAANQRLPTLSPFPDRQGLTDAQGEARFEPMPPGLLNASVEILNHRFSGQVELAAGAKASLTVKVLHDQVLSGVVLGPGGPLEHAQVTVQQATDGGHQGIPAHNTLSTDHEGKFEVPLPKGRFELLVTHAQGTKRLSVDVPCAPLRITLEATLGLRGRVVEADGKPAPGYRVAVFLTGEANFFDEPAAKQESGPDGSFAFQQLAAGSYRVEAALANHSEARKAVQTVELSASTRPLELVLPAGQQVEGDVLDADHQPVEGAQVNVNAPGQGMGDRATSDEKGHFVVRNVQGAKVMVSAFKQGYVSATKTDVVPPARGLELVLSRTARVKGRVLLPNHSPAPLFGLAGKRFEGPTGEFEVELSMSRRQAVLLEVPEVGNSYWLLESRPGETADVGDLVALAGPKLKVKVFDGQGQPVMRAMVNYLVETPDRGRVMAGGSSVFGRGHMPWLMNLPDDQGVFTLDPVATPGLSLMASGQGGWKEVPVTPGTESVELHLEARSAGTAR